MTVTQTNTDPMQSGSRGNFRFTHATELFQEIPEISEDITARPDSHNCEEFIRALVGSQTPEEAITFSAFVLPRRFSVWWGHECLKLMEGTLDPHDVRMLELAAVWVGDPEEDNRYAALDAAMESAAKTPGVWIAFGAGWSGGSMVGAELPPVPPPPHLTARAVSAGVLSVLARVEVTDRLEQLDRFARMAIRIGTDT